MRKLMSVVLLLSGLTVACGSDGDKKEDTDGGDNNGGGNLAIGDGSAGDDEYPGCDRTLTPAEIPDYEGDKPMFSTADLMACQTKCMGQATSCFSEENCPGFDNWNNCAFDNLIACVGSKGGSCREELENLDCCGNASKCDPDDTDPACIQAACGDEITAFSDCFNADAACNDTAPRPCFSAASAAPTAPAARLRTSDLRPILRALHQLR